jgi:hypothetical protein
MAVEPAVSPHTILLRGDKHKRHGENRAAAGLSPGHLVTKNANDEVLKHATAGVGVNTQIYVAKEMGLMGTDINTAYATGDLVFHHQPQKGDRLYCRVAAAATAILFNDKLTSDGAGGLKKSNGTTDVNIAAAAEPLDNSAGGADAFIRADWLV